MTYKRSQTITQAKETHSQHVAFKRKQVFTKITNDLTKNKGLKQFCYRLEKRGVFLFIFSFIFTRHYMKNLLTSLKIIYYSLIYCSYSNRETGERLDVALIQSKISEVRLRWYGHVKRSDSVATTALDLEDSTKRTGRPHKRWLHCASYYI